MKSALFEQSHEHQTFFKNPIGYNTLFSFASIQYQRLQTAPFGLPVIKSQGAMRHYRSAVQPNFKHPEMYGNFYVYEGQAAAERRTSLGFGGIDSEVNNLNKVFLNCRYSILHFMHKNI